MRMGCRPALNLSDLAACHLFGRLDTRWTSPSRGFVSSLSIWFYLVPPFVSIHLVPPFVSVHLVPPFVPIFISAFCFRSLFPPFVPVLCFRLLY